MIIDIPTYEEFEFSGVTFLNLAWDPIAELLNTVVLSEMNYWDDDGEIKEEYWQAAQMPLITSLSLAQQGTELLLKGKIAKTSPFLLISGNPSSWPKNRLGVKSCNPTILRTIGPADGSTQQRLDIIIALPAKSPCPQTQTVKPPRDQAVDLD